MKVNRITALRLLFVLIALTLTAGCGGGSTPQAAAPLSAGNVNLIFVVTPDLANDTLGDIDPDTANLTNQGLQRSLLLAGYLKRHLLGFNNVTGIHVLEPMTHLQTENKYPDMAAIGFIQQFALLNQVTILGTTGNSYPLFAAYGSLEDVPDGVVKPDPYIPGAQGLVFDDASGNNAALAARIINNKTAGYYVFSAPWTTTSALLASINNSMGYNLKLPTAYKGPNVVYAITVTPSGNARLVTFDSKLKPAAGYPQLPAPVAGASCTQQSYFSYTRTNGVNGVVVPPGTNTNQTVYLIRHAEAHPSTVFEDGNYVGAGQWRALALPGFLNNSLRGQPKPTMVYSIDPAQSFAEAGHSMSYVRPSLTVLPYAIANNLPYKLVSKFFIGTAASESVAKATSDFFFTGGDLSNQTVLVAWEHKHFPTLLTYLLQSYGGTEPVPSFSWPESDYDTIWTIKLDAQGNLTVTNALCEGIDSSSLPAKAPHF